MNKNEIITQNAVKYVKENSKKIIMNFVGTEIQTPKNKTFSVSFFMAGSPGAGKTETSKALIKLIEKDTSIKSVAKIIRIDPDDIRKLLPKYNGKNSYLFQTACSVAVEKIHDYVLKKDLDFLLDSTFSNYVKSRENIIRSLKRNRFIVINYIYQDPIIAWEFTQKREALEGRNIPKKSFINHFFEAKETVDKIKTEFKDKIHLHFLKKDLKSDYSQIKLDIKNINDYIRIGYTKKELEEIL